MDPLDVDSTTSWHRQHRTVLKLLEEHRAAKAIAFAQSLKPSVGQEDNVLISVAEALSAGGIQIRDEQTTERGVAIWNDLADRRESPQFVYNAGNAELELWQLHVNLRGIEFAYTQKYELLKNAREKFQSVASDEAAPNQIRLRALTDAGNSFDNCGRYIDALNCYSEALDIDSQFGMASGNRGILLINAAPIMGPHAFHVYSEAAGWLDSAIANHESVLLHGGQQALDAFNNAIATMGQYKNSTTVSASRRPEFTEPHDRWCIEQDLLLHISPNCLDPDSQFLDSISPFTDSRLNEHCAQSSVAELASSFNSLQRDFVTSRYLHWLAVADSSPIASEIQSRSARVLYPEIAPNEIWDLRVGITLHALALAVEVLDSVAAFVHRFFGIKRARQVNFQNFPFVDRNSSSEFHPRLLSEITGTPANRSLTALIDLSWELAKQPHSQLRASRAIRNAATHRFVAVTGTTDRRSGEWILDISEDELNGSAIEALRYARMAVLHLAQFVSSVGRVTTNRSPGQT